jgi:predicted DNA-binding transcriptional regulator AlpA
MNGNKTLRKSNRSPSLTENGQNEVCEELRQLIQSIRARPSDSIVRRREIKSRCGRAVPTTYLDIAKGVFPPPFPIGTRAVGFSANEIDAWITARSYASLSKAPVDMKAFVTLLVQSRDHGSLFSLPTSK